MTARRWALALGVAAAVAFALLASVHLTAQGPQYDELHQAVGAFTWIGAPPPGAFCLDFHGICVLNTTYSAALKTHLYGLFLKLSGHRFDLAEWRWVGILTIALGLALFAAAASSALRLRELALFYALLLTDGSLLLLGRFDWGPVAFAFLLRMAMLALWLRGESGEEPGPANSWALGALAGFAAFEKLSSYLLILPLAAMMLGSPRRRGRRHLLAALSGVAMGALPLVLVNLGWLAKKGELISLRGLRGEPGLGAFDFVRELLALGYGGRVRAFMLGQPPSPLLERCEVALLLALLSLAAMAAMAAILRPGEDVSRHAGIAVASYVAIGAGLWAMPRATWAHHWILATPFQYLAIVLAAPAFPWRGQRGGRRAAGLAFGLLLAGWLAVRLLSLVSLEGALRRDSAAEAWDPSLAALGRFAARQPAGTLFLATDWGVATQIACFGNGRPGGVVEPFWDERGLRAPEVATAIRDAHTLYLVRLRRATGRFPVTERIERDLPADPAWHPVPAEPETAAWRAVEIRKMVRSGAPPT